MLKLIKDQTKL